MSATQPLQETLDTYAAALAAQRAELDALKTSLSALATVAVTRPANRACRFASELGCIPGDPRVDNAQFLQPALDAMYAIELDQSGVLYTSPLKPVGGQSTVIRGQSAGYRHGAKGMTGLAPFDPAQPCLIEFPGDATKSNGQVAVLRDLYLQGTDKCDGIRILGGRAVSLENLVIRQCKRGVAVEPVISCYATSIRNSSILGCDLGLYVANAPSVCCLAVYSTEIMGGRQGILLDGWRRGALFAAVVVEGQTETKVEVRNSRATFAGCYFEGDGGLVGLLATKGSRVNLIDTSAGGHKVSSDSQLNWIGDNMQAGTIGW